MTSSLNTVTRFSFSTGAFVSFYLNPTKNIGNLNSPVGILIGPDGNYWVASGNGTNKITRFNITTGAKINDPFLGVSATAGHHEQQYENGLLCVANGSRNNVVAYDASAYEPSAFTVAKHATDQSGTLAPSEMGNSNVQASFSFGDGFEFVIAGSQGLTNPKNMLFIDINDPPAVNAGADQSAAPGQVVTLNGAGSSDPEGLPITWQWTQISGTPVLPGPSVVTGGATSSSVGFIAPNAGGPLVFQLTASDGVKSATDTVSIALSGTPVDSAPVVTLQAPDGVTIQGATLRGTVNPVAGAAACRFEYGLTTSYGGQTAIQPITGQQSVSATLTGLAPGQTYRYRLTATNAVGTQFTADGTFATYYEQREIVVESPPDGDVTDGSGEIDLGKVIFGRSGIARLITIRNAGATDLQLGPITKDGTDPGDFAVSTPAGSLLPAGASESFTVIFAPGALGVRSAVIHLANNDADEEPFDIALTGTGVTPPEAWRFQYFQTIPNTGTAADSANPDRDGLVNLLERAFNLTPTQPALPILTSGTGTSGLPLIRRTGQPPVFSIQYLRRKAAANSGLAYTPQFSSALDGSGDWSTAIGTETVQSIDSEWERVTLEENASGKEKRFGRVKVVGGE